MDENGFPPVALDVLVLDCRDVAALSDFYVRFLGWVRSSGGDDEWMEIVSPAGGTMIGFQRNEDDVPPVWPDAPGAQQMMVHMDFSVRDTERLAAAVRHALACGATMPGVQYNPDRWVTLLDPAGHPFCLVVAH